MSGECCLCRVGVAFLGDLCVECWATVNWFGGSK